MEDRVPIVGIVADKPSYGATDHKNSEGLDVALIKRKTLNYDDILLELGEFGPWQMLLSFLFWIPPLVAGAVFLLGTFVALEPDLVQCVVPGCSTEDISHLGPDVIQACSHLEPLHEDTNLNQGLNVSCPLVFSNVSIDCTTDGLFNINPTPMASTLITEWNLVCSDQWKVAFVSSFFMVGLMFGSYLSGWLSDLAGRRPALIVSILLTSLPCLVGAVLPEYWSFTFLRMITAVGSQGLFILGFSLSVELVGARESPSCLPWVSYKALLAMFIHMPYALGQALVSLIAYFVRNWRSLQLVMGCISLSQVILWFFLPESPRWLLSSDKIPEAKAVLDRAAKMNNKKLSEEWFYLESQDGNESTGGDNGEKLGLLHLFKGSSRFNTYILLICWPVVALGYFGIALSMSSLGDDIFISNLLAALIELPSYIITLLMLDVWGRRPVFSLSLVLTGCFCLGTGLMGSGAAKTGLALIGKFFASAAFSIVYIYTAELYPTAIRNTAIGIHSLSARIGAIIAPQLALYLPAVTFEALPMLIMGGCSVFGGLLALLLPETMGTSLPENFSDIERLKDEEKSIWTCVNPIKQKRKVYQTINPQTVQIDK